MAEKVDIWMPWYIPEFLAATAHLSTEEKGAYLLLIGYSWMNGPLPKDGEQLRRIAGIEKKSWPGVWNLLRGFWSDTDAGYIQKRTEKERAKAQQNKITNVNRAKDAASKRWERRRHAPSSSPSNAPSMPEAMLEQCPLPVPTPLPDSSHEESLSGRESAGPVPVNLNPAALEIACAHPAALARSLRPMEIAVEDVVVIVTAIRNEAREQGVSVDAAAIALLGFTRRYAAAVALWPPGEQRFALGIAKFFTSFEYRKDPETWRRDGTNRQQQHNGKQHGTRPRTAAEERHRDGLDQILSAFPELAGIAGDGNPDGPSEGELRDADLAGRMGGSHPVTLDVHSGTVWH